MHTPKDSFDREAFAARDTTSPPVWATATFSGMSSLLGAARARCLLGDYVDYLGKAEAEISLSLVEPHSLRRTLHDLHSTSGMLGFDALSETCYRLLADTSTGPSSEKVARLLELTRQSSLAARRFLALSGEAAAA